MNNRHIGGRSSETLSHPIDINNKQLSEENDYLYTLNCIMKISAKRLYSKSPVLLGLFVMKVSAQVEKPRKSNGA
jgi:hypothetical protein